MAEFFEGLPVWANFLCFALGAGMIDRGAKLLVRSSISISEKTGIPKIVIGATIMSVATTFPEFTVSLVATILGYNQMAVGNLVGSCACNIGLVCGCCVLILPVAVKKRTLIEKGGVMVLGGLATLCFAFAGGVPRWGGLLLLAGFALYVKRTVSTAKYDQTTVEPTEEGTSGLSKDILKFLGGMVFVGLASTLLVENGKQIAVWFGVPPLIIALTLVALGTSLPELVTAIRSALMGHSELSVGNVIGSNVLNLFWALGTCAVVRPLAMERQTLVLDSPFMILLMTVLVLWGLLRGRLGRASGAAILAIYAVYIALMLKFFT